MFRTVLFPVLASGVFLAGCQNLSQQDQANLGLISGAAGGVLLAGALDANPAWTVAAGVAGAALGTQIARNSQTGECAYYAGQDAFGRTIYRTGPC